MVEKTMRTYIKKMTTLVNSGNDYIKAIISVRILGIAVIVLKGLNTRITLRALS
jgi:hypothetical protein